MHDTDAFGQPVGPVVAGWTPRPRPPRAAMAGRLCRLEPLDPDRHADDLHAAFAADHEGRMWAYMAYGPFPTPEDYRRWAGRAAANEDPQFFTILDRDGACGVASFLRIDPANGVIEIGHIAFAPRLQRTAAATEALFLMMRRAFDELGYRRLEWKCNALNAASRRAAERLGFTYEGVFRQAVVVKGRNRDTAWFAIIDADWPAIQQGFERWLSPDNFDADGRQRRSLAACRG